MAQCQLLGADRNQKDLSMAVLPILCPEGSGQVPPVLPVLTGMSALQCYPHYPFGIDYQLCAFLMDDSQAVGNSYG